MKTSLLLSLIAGAGMAAGTLSAPCAAQEPAAPSVAPSDEPGNPVDPQEQDKKMQWWRDAHFGMFIHYGLYSGLECAWEGQDGRGEWTQHNMGIDTETYAKAALPLFKPAPGCAAEWVKLAQEAGCKYMVLTSKHHEGFCLFDAPNTDYSTGKLLGRDLVREFMDACHAAGMRTGLYHSVIDWHHPDYDYTIRPQHPCPANQRKMLEERGIPRNQESYIKYLHEQAETLVTKYGKLDILWWDFSTLPMAGERAWKASKLMAMCREKQPGIIMNNRLWDMHTCPTLTDKADFTTPEQFVPARNKIPAYDWESCMTVGHHWGYSRYETDYKSPATCINALESCVARGGNMLLNVGPKPEGSIPQEVQHVFRQMGAWMRVNGEAVYGSRAVLKDGMPENLRMVTGADGSSYVFLQHLKEGEEPAAVQIPVSCMPQQFSLHILGQPECKPALGITGGNAVITIPAAAWKNAVEGLPVLKIGI